MCVCSLIRILRSCTLLFCQNHFQSNMIWTERGRQLNSPKLHFTKCHSTSSWLTELSSTWLLWLTQVRGARMLKIMTKPVNGKINTVWWNWVKNKKQTHTIFLKERGSSPTVNPFLQQRLLNMASAITSLSLVERMLTTSSARTTGDTSTAKNTGKIRQITYCQGCIGWLI